MLGISGTELVIIGLFGFLIFGPDKLPQVGRTVGRAIRQFKNAQEEMNKVVRAEVYDPLADDEPLADLRDLFSEITGEKKPEKQGKSSDTSQARGTMHSGAPDVPETLKSETLNPSELSSRPETLNRSEASKSSELSTSFDTTVSGVPASDVIISDRAISDTLTPDVTTSSIGASDISSSDMLTSPVGTPSSPSFVTGEAQRLIESDDVVMSREIEGETFAQKRARIKELYGLDDEDGSCQ